LARLVVVHTHNPNTRKDLKVKGSLGYIERLAHKTKTKTKTKFV
jgi:hypothetical protein